jgi:hypothetical protein
MPPSDAARARSASPNLFGSPPPRGGGSPVLFLNDQDSSGEDEGPPDAESSSWEYAQQPEVFVPETQETQVLGEPSADERVRDAEALRGTKRRHDEEDIERLEAEVVALRQKVKRCVGKYEATERRLEAAIRREEQDKSRDEEKRLERVAEQRYKVGVRDLEARIDDEHEAACKALDAEAEERTRQRLSEVRERAIAAGESRE